MKLPGGDRAIVPERKLTEYLLSEEHEVGKCKAVFFLSHGFALEAWRVLEDALLRHALEHEVATVERRGRGVYYGIIGPLASPDGRSPWVNTVWEIVDDNDPPRFITSYPARPPT